MTTPIEDRVEAATKLLRGRIPMILNFADRPAAYTIMAGVEDLARDILELASTAPLLEEIERAKG